ncbi:hypothetical protein [Desulfovibrio litoralis]|uniref:Lipoprotein n=1 Tax=Desulfovibrio litoralis DSM 11393 TaxID=1121455 RepID=A0A1M7T6M2_9BACT|nr:hypothetical protein [Desulfovibrio litoralis]SHN66368.1 hypothetical protein SAMN02745728_01627 [Desulfovibrio litoralis DSM 11393]
MLKHFRLLSLLFCLALTACVTTAPKSANYSQLQASFADSAWNGATIPSGEVCNKFNSRPGNAPSIKVSNIPNTTVRLELKFSDETARAAFRNGGHGIISYTLPTAGMSEVVIPSFPGQVSNLPPNFQIVRNFTSEAWDSGTGYLPPCSGGKGNLYTVVISGFDAQGSLTGEVKLKMGRY